MKNFKDLIILMTLIYSACLYFIIKDINKVDVVEMPAIEIVGNIEMDEIAFDEELVITGYVSDIEMDELVITSSL